MIANLILVENGAFTTVNAVVDVVLMVFAGLIKVN